MAHAYAALGEKAKALAWLRRYDVRRDQHFQMHLRCDPPFDPLADDPAFRALLTLPRPLPVRLARIGILRLTSRL